MNVNIETLDTKIQELEAELQELKSARNVLIRLEKGGLSGLARTGVDEASTPKLPETGQINVDDLVVPTKPKAKTDTLEAHVRQVIERFGSQEFTVNHVYAALKQMGKASDAKHFKNRVSILIRNMTADGDLERTHKGVGSDPHRYKRSVKLESVKTGTDEGILDD